MIRRQELPKVNGVLVDSLRISLPGIEPLTGLKPIVGKVEIGEETFWFTDVTEDGYDLEGPSGRMTIQISAKQETRDARTDTEGTAGSDIRSAGAVDRGNGEDSRGTDRSSRNA